MKFYVIDFNTKAFKMLAEVVEIVVKKDEIYNEISKVLESDSIEFIDYSNEIVMIIDEMGKFKRSNPVFQLKTSDGILLEIAGKILFARNIENEFSTDIGSITYEDIFNLRLNLDIELIGITKGKV